MVGRFLVRLDFVVVRGGGAWSLDSGKAATRERRVYVYTKNRTGPRPRLLGAAVLMRRCQAYTCTVSTSRQSRQWLIVVVAIATDKLFTFSNVRYFARLWHISSYL